MAPPTKTSREAILKVAEDLAKADGLRGVAVRAIAAQLSVAPGTIYNFVGDVDDIILLVNARSLQRLQPALRNAIVPGRTAIENAFAVADAYVVFVLENQKSWGMLLEHSLTDDKSYPDWFGEEVERTVGIVDEVLKPMITDATERRRSVAILWASLQGLASLAASTKLGAINQDDPRELARLLISRFFAYPREYVAAQTTSATDEQPMPLQVEKTRAEKNQKAR